MLKTLKYKCLFIKIIVIVKRVFGTRGGVDSLLRDKMGATVRPRGTRGEIQPGSESRFHRRPVDQSWVVELRNSIR